MPRLTSAARWVLPAIVALLWLGLAGPLGSLGGGLSDVQENDSAAFLPDSAESTRVTELQRGFQTSRALPVILLWEGDGALDQQQLAQIADRIDQATTIAGDALVGEASPAIPSQDGAAVQAVLPIEPDLGDALPALVADLRGIDGVDGTTEYVTGPGASFSDFADGFSGIDGLLLLAAFGVVLLILLIVYRSPILPFLVIGTAGLALTASMAVAYLLAKAGWIAVNGQSQGIASILVVGAATDYGLLLVARYREELREEQSKYVAMRIALRQSWAPIVASGATVILGVLCLLFSDLGSNRGLGPISAVSVALAMVAALTFLPAVLVLLGRAAFWPFRPQFGSEHRHGRGWERVAQIVGRRPWRVLIWSLVGTVRRRLVRPHVLRRRHPAEPGGARRHRVGDRPGGAGAPLRRRRRQPRGDHHAGGRLAGRRRGRRRRSTASPRSRRSPGPSGPGSRATRSSWTDWSGSTPPSPRPPTPTRRSTPSRTCGRRSAAWIPTRSSAGRRPATSTPARPAPATCASSCRACCW